AISKAPAALSTFAAVTTVTPVSAISTRAIASRTISARSRSALAAAALARRPAFPITWLLLLFCHVLNLSYQSGPFEGHQAGGPQFPLRRFPARHLTNQVRAQFLEFTIARATQDAVETPLEAPGALQIRSALSVRIAPVEAPQLIEKLFGHPKIVD